MKGPDQETNIIFYSEWSYSTTSTWFPGQTNGQFLPSVIIANSSQLLLSVAYFQFNSLFTQFHAAREWARLSTSYRPLRVTDPRGSQTSTYVLQLPWSYSIPLLAAGISLHWLMSRTFFVLIAEGGYFNAENLGLGAYPPDPDLGLSADAFVGVGYSVWAIVAVFLALLVLFAGTVASALRRLPGNMPLVGSNSAAMAAACGRATPTPTAVAEMSPERAESGLGAREKIGLLDQSTEYENYLDDGETAASFDPRSSSDANPKPDLLLLAMAQSEVRWGAVAVPPELQGKFGDVGAFLGHLGFGMTGDDVQEPQDGRLYV